MWRDDEAEPGGECAGIAYDNAVIPHIDLLGRSVFLIV
jgi:hypothetical protein